MKTFAYGAASSASGAEKFFTNPVRGVFAAVETLGSDDGKLASAVVQAISEINPDEEQYLGLLQYQVSALLKDFAGKGAVSVALTIHSGADQVRWFRVGASGISLFSAQSVLPIACPRVWNPRGLSGEEYALPAAALGLGDPQWERGMVELRPGDLLALHTSGFPVFASGLLPAVGMLSGGDLQATAQAWVEGGLQTPEPRPKGSTIVLVAAPQAALGLAVSL